MKVSRWVLALFLVSAPVLMCGSAYASCDGSACKSEDVPPVDKSAAPLPWLAPDEPTADTADNCGGSGCLFSDEEDSTAADPDQRRAPPPPIIPCGGSGC
jgi:hypothetical protein